MWRFDTGALELKLGRKGETICAMVVVLDELLLCGRCGCPDVAAALWALRPGTLRCTLHCSGSGEILAYNLETTLQSHRWGAHQGGVLALFAANDKARPATDACCRTAHAKSAASSATRLHAAHRFRG